jgi:transglutaminase-like putative cysteine protease
MTEILPDTIRRLYTDPGEYIDSDHPAVQRFAESGVPAEASAREKASVLYKAVRDGIRYNPYVSMRVAETFRASSVLAAGQGYCVGKAALYAAACRVHGIPARVGFADVKNHLTTEKLRASMGTDIFTWHGFTEVHVDGAWRKATRSAPRSACARSISTATPMRCCIPSTAKAVPTCNTSMTAAAITTCPRNS